MPAALAAILQAILGGGGGSAAAASVGGGAAAGEASAATGARLAAGGAEAGAASRAGQSESKGLLQSLMGLIRPASGGAAAAPKGTPATPQAASGGAAAKGADSGGLFRSLFNRVRGGKAPPVGGSPPPPVKPTGTPPAGRTPRQPQPAAPIGQSAAKPKIDYGRMVADMGNPQASGDERKRARQEDEEASKAVKGMTDSYFDSIPILGKLNKAAFNTAKQIAMIPLAGVALMFAIDKWTDHLVNSRKVLAKYNGQIAAAMARLEFQQIRQQIQMGAATAGSTEGLSKAIMDFRKEMQPIKQDVRTIVNVLETGFLRLVTATVKGAKDNARFAAWAMGPGTGAFFDEATAWIRNQELKEVEGKQRIPNALLDEMKKRDKGPNRTPLPPLRFP